MFYLYNVNIIKKIKALDTNAVIYFEDSESKPIYSYIKLNNDIIVDIIEKEKILRFQIFLILIKLRLKLCSNNSLICFNRSQTIFKNGP